MTVMLGKLTLVRVNWTRKIRKDANRTKICKKIRSQTSATANGMLIRWYVLCVCIVDVGVHVCAWVCEWGALRKGGSINDRFCGVNRERESEREGRRGWTAALWRHVYSCGDNNQE